MFRLITWQASMTLAASVPEELLKQGRIFPPLKDIRDVSQKLAVASCVDYLENVILYNYFFFSRYFLSEYFFYISGLYDVK
jgi:hypothetical protein